MIILLGVVRVFCLRGLRRSDQIVHSQRDRLGQIIEAVMNQFEAVVINLNVQAILGHGRAASIIAITALID